MLVTMPDLQWMVSVEGGGNHWRWLYTFSRFHTVTWRDQGNGMHGNGTWQIEQLPGKGMGHLITRWFPSKTWEDWGEMPITSSMDGTCYMDGKTYTLQAEALNWYLDVGDVVYYSGSPLVRVVPPFIASVIYPDEVRTGGSIAWICRNPGNIRPGAHDEAAKFGAYKGKQLVIPKLGPYAIFPDWETGLDAVSSVLRGYGRLTIKQAMNKYAGKEDPGNNPDQYAANLAAGLKVTDDTLLTDLSHQQMTHMAELITGQEGTFEGTKWARDSPNLPDEIRQRLFTFGSKRGPQP